MLKGITSQRLVAWFMAGMALLNFPLLILWDKAILVFGLPLFPLALFVIWILLLVVLAWIMETHED